MPRNPFAKSPVTGATALAEPATDRAINYLRDLMLDKAAHEGRDLVQCALTVDEWLSRHKGKVEVSENIDRLKAEGFTGSKYRDDIEDGFYELADGRIVKIVHAVHGSGRQYGKALDPQTGAFNRLMGAVRIVRESATKLTLERAKELGHLYGMCIRCGATLTDEDSIANGIGPICATKF